MKKKLLLFITAVITLGFASCSEDECDHKIPVPNDLDIAGNWYEEAENEEMRLNENGTFYDKYCNVLKSNETEGRWEYDKANKKFTQTYSFMGQTQVNDWTVKDLTETSFIIYSTTVAEHKYEKIVETYNLEVGGTANIQYSTNVTSYTSKNARLASVTSDGKITAEGEKGTTYIKVATDNGNVWVKVVVGEECFDLWYDYVSVIGMDYTNMRNTLNRIGEPYTGDDGYSYGFINDIHDIIDITKVFLCPEDGLTTEIQLTLKDAVPESKILAYMDSHYYRITDNDSYIFYSTKESRDESKAMVTYNKKEKSVIFCETAHFLQTAHIKEPWNDNIQMFGKSKNSIKNAMGQKSYSYLLTDDTYSDNGSDYYAPNDLDEYVIMIGFVFNPDNLCSEYWVYLNYNIDKTKVKMLLDKKYVIEDSEETDDSFIYYTTDKTLKVTFDIRKNAVGYTKLSMKQYKPSTETFGKYYDGLGMTAEQINSRFGVPYEQTSDGPMFIIGSDYVSYVKFAIDANTGKCWACRVYTNNTQTKEDITKYLSARYTLFKTAEDGSLYAYTNGPTVAESTMGVVYRPNNNTIQYELLNTTTTAKAARISVSTVFK